jgi:hypothetical protein
MAGKSNRQNCHGRTTTLPASTAQRMPSKNTARVGDEGKAVRREGPPAALLFPGSGNLCPNTSPTAKKTLTGGRNIPLALSLTFKRRAKPPAPHPQSPGVEPRLL